MIICYWQKVLTLFTNYWFTENIRCLFLLLQDKLTVHKKMNFSIKDLFSTCDILRIWSHLLKKPLMKTFLCGVNLYNFSKESLISISQSKTKTYKYDPVCHSWWKQYSVTTFTVFGLNFQSFSTCLGWTKTIIHTQILLEFCTVCK